MALATFIISLLLATRAVEPVEGWLIALAVLSGLDMLGSQPWRISRMSLFAMRVVIFLISLLLVTEAVQPQEGWLIALAVLTGLSMLGIGGGGTRIYLGGWRPRRWLREEW